MFQKLGQHFLINQSAIKKMIKSLKLKSGETIVEIGPGKGALTFPLIKECGENDCKIIAVERDPELAASLELLAVRNNLQIEIIKDDALKILSEITKTYKLKPISYKLVGNIPYYITGKLLRILSELENKPELTILMIQKEVAERITAKSPKMNLLAAAVQFWAKPEILFTLKPDNFSPPPKVESAVIKLTTLHPKPYTLNPEIYYKLIKILFKQPRKTILNNLKTGLKITPELIENNLKSLGIDPEFRPQNLSVAQIINFVRSDLTK